MQRPGHFLLIHFLDRDSLDDDRAVDAVDGDDLSILTAKTASHDADRVAFPDRKGAREMDLRLIVDLRREPWRPLGDLSQRASLSRLRSARVSGGIKPLALLCGHSTGGIMEVSHAGPADEIVPLSCHFSLRLSTPYFGLFLQIFSSCFCSFARNTHRDATA